MSPSMFRAIQPNITNIFYGIVHLNIKANSIMKIWDRDGKKNLFVSTKFEKIYSCKVWVLKLGHLVIFIFIIFFKIFDDKMDEDVQWE